MHQPDIKREQREGQREQQDALDDDADHAPQPLAEIGQNRGGGAPDIMAAHRYRRRTRARRPCHSALLRSRLAGSSRKASGTSNTSSTSPGSGTSAKPFAEHAHHRHDGKAGAGFIGVEKARERHEVRADAGFFMRLAQGGGDSDRRRLRCTRPPGKLTWPAWRARCAVRRVNSTVGSRRATIGSSTAAGDSLRGVCGRVAGIEIVIAARRHQQRRRRMRQQMRSQRVEPVRGHARAQWLPGTESRACSSAPRPNGKNTPSLHTPSRPSWAPSPGTARSAS